MPIAAAGMQYCAHGKVAAALQDQHRGLLMGERNFGKAGVQLLFSLDAAHAVKLTTAR